MLKEHELLIVKACSDKYKESKIKLKREVDELNKVIKERDTELSSQKQILVKMQKDFDETKNEADKLKDKVV